MKKLLLKTTALIATAGLASAQGVELSGSAEMGIFGGDLFDPLSDGIQFHNDIDVKFTLSGETDNGLTFGATIDLDELNGDDIDPRAGGRCRSGTPGRSVSTFVGRGGVCPGYENDSSVFLSGDFGTITMGDTDGAFDWALQELDRIADIADANTSHDGYSGNDLLDRNYDGQIARYDYSFGDFAFAVSVDLDDDGVGDPTFGIGGKYDGRLGNVDLGVGIGYQSEGQFAIYGISIDAQFENGIRAILNYSDLDDLGGRESHLGVGLFYSMDAISVGVNYGSFELTSGDHRSGFGVAGNYELGGGAVVQFGYGSSTPASGPTVDGFSLGVAMTF